MEPDSTGVQNIMKANGFLLFSGNHLHHLKSQHFFMPRVHYALLILFILLTGIYFVIPEREIDFSDEEILTISNLDEIEEVPASDEFGIVVDRVKYKDGTIRPNESLYVLLREEGVSPQMIYEIQQKAKGSVDLTSMKPGQNYRIYRNEDGTFAFSWRRSSVDFTTIRWDEDILIKSGRLPIERTIRSVSGTIRSSLANSLMEKAVSQKLVVELANIYAWTVDFYGLQRGDQFKAVYEDRYVNGDYIGIGRIHAAEFVHRGKVLKAYYFDNGKQKGYFDEQGNSMRRMMMRVPFAYNPRISSSFSRNRLHPILNRRRPHYGTDYAAPSGTPILAAGDGVVTEAQRRGGNGNIVQIKHNSVYKTAYLHMSRFGPGIRSGVRVEQGQVIGYVGQTGLATGPHLCYRLYKHGQPVNSVTYDFPPSEGIQDEYITEYQNEVLRLEEMIRSLGASGELALN